MDHKYREVLREVYTILGFSDEKKDQAVEDFKKRFAFELLKSVQNELPQEQQDWLRENSNGTISPSDPQVLAIQKTISEKYSSEELFAKSQPVFKKLLNDYIDFTSKDLNSDQISQLRDIASR